MEWYCAWRAVRPGRWLAVALAADLAVYATDPDRLAAGLPWLLLDLWLARRIWKHGSGALAVFRFLQALAVALFGVVIVWSHWDDHLGTEATPVTVALWALSTWCLFAPALSLHVDAGRQRIGQVTASR